MTIAIDSPAMPVLEVSELPRGWQYVSLGKLVSVKNGADYKADEVAEGGYPVIGSGGEFARSSSYGYEGESVLFGRKGTIDRPLHVSGRFWTVDTMFYTVIGPRLVGRFLYYFATTVDYGYYATNTAVPSMTQRDIATFRVPLPGIEVQRQIADFLDAHTAKIDVLIGKQERLIETLAERRQAVISHAVTKGLDPNAPMKDSSVSWLGLVPEHWKVIRVKRTTVLITDGAHISPETENGVYDFVSTRDISAEGIDFEGALKTSASSYDFLVNNGCQPAAGDVLFSKDGTVGRTVVVEEDRSFVVASSLIIVRPAQVLIDSYFLNYMFQSAALQEQVRSFVKGAGLPRLSIANLLKVVGVLPPLTEQKEIVDYLDRETSQIDALSAKAREMIDVLKERRQALISAAVTGKIDVRGLA